MPFRIGEVRCIDDQDFKELKALCLGIDGTPWQKAIDKPDARVWTLPPDPSNPIQMIRMQCPVPTSAEVLFDTLMDENYRKKWDKNMVESREVCSLNPNNDISYYSVRSPAPLKNRDLVLLRSWLELMEERFIVSYSVNHAAIPEKPGVVRAVAYINGYYIAPTPSGCMLSFVTRADPRGKLPPWVISRVTTWLAPKTLRRITKAARNYAPWKATHQPKYKPWRYPEQQDLPRLKWNDVLLMDSVLSAPVVDETEVTETELPDEEG